jgi:hypothetical protein
VIHLITLIFLPSPLYFAGANKADWVRCESRHEQARITECLGVKRPLTGWEEAGACKLPDNAWNDWARGQPDRVLDLIDIDFLREVWIFF